MATPLALISAVEVLRKNLTNRQKFNLIEDAIDDFLASEEAKEVSGLSNATLYFIYTRLRKALLRHSEKPLHLRIQGKQEEDGTALSPWKHLCQIAQCSSSTLSKAIDFFANSGLINRTIHLRNGLPLFISFNLPADSFVLQNLFRPLQFFLAILRILKQYYRRKAKLQIIL